MSGLFISFEGGEGCGKTTQIKRLITKLRDDGLDVVLTREVGGTEGAELVRAMVQHGDAYPWDARCEALLIFAARRDHVERVIKPALARGALVLSDRFYDSSYVYQGMAQGIPLDEMDILRRFAIGDFNPALTVLFDFDPAEGLARAHQDLLTRVEDNSRFESKGMAFHEKVREGYLTMAKRDPHRVRPLDASGTIDEVEARLHTLLAPYLNAYKKGRAA